jgi:predicted ATP-grasp superfamily ATP-dependent carboligase
MPSAIDMIRRLGERAHQVFASDTFRTSPGSHSRYVEESILTASPQADTLQFVRDVARAVEDHRIELVLPVFEEVFYLARHRGELPGTAEYFFSDLEVLRRLHDKSAFARLAMDLGLAVPRHFVARTREALQAAIRELGDYIAKPVFSRGGVELFSSHPPLERWHDSNACNISPDRPWLVSEYIPGVDVCSFSVAHHGRITGHTTYVHPREIEHAGGIVFESVDEPGALRVAQAVAEATGYHGHISFDYRRTERGLVLIECNPRPTAGIHMMSSDDFEAALLDRPGPIRVTPAGVRRKYGVALLRDMVVHPRDFREDLRHLLSPATEVIADPKDPKPALFQFLSYGRVLAFRLKNPGKIHPHKALMAAWFDDVCYDGEPIV